jgi:hypothetical protein
MLPCFLTAVLLFSHGYVSAQVRTPSFVRELETLQVLADSIQKGTTDPVRLEHAGKFDSLLFDVLKKEGSMDYGFDSIKNLSVLSARNNSVRVYTFICPMSGGKQYRYFGFVQWRDKKGEPAHLIRLTEAMPDRQTAEKLKLNSEYWPGALYYKMITTSIKGRTFYTLLGWRGVDNETTMKVIEVMTIENGNVWFGAPLFQTDYGLRHRILFEYNARAVMSLKFEEKKKRIVFDHLSPPSPQLSGNFKTYGPDFTYDAYQWKQGKWMLYKNVELRNPPSSDPASPSGKIKRKVLYKPLE